jgi:hypothetical protein
MACRPDIDEDGRLTETFGQTRLGTRSLVVTGARAAVVLAGL